jgi:DHA1 family tetracycline resistance protein-like MFS transporter
LVAFEPVGALMAFREHPAALGLAGTYFLLQLAHQALPATWVLYTAYRYSWTPFQTGLSLAVVGLMAGIVQGGLTRVVVEKLGEKKTIFIGLCISVCAYIGYGTATQGWMIYIILAFGCLAGVTMPTVQAVISRQVRADEQGGVQGALGSLASITGIIGPAIVSTLFGYFISAKAPVKLPGAPYYFSAALMLCAMYTTAHALARVQTVPPKPRAAVA